MRIRTKVCGITRLQDAQAAVELGIDAVGFNFVPGSPREISVERAREISGALPPFVTRVGVFADARPPSMEAKARLIGLDWLQLHGDEEPEVCAGLTLRWYKVLRVGPGFAPEDVARYTSGTVLLDAYSPEARGGTGRSFDWSLARRAGAYARVIVAGGLSEENVEQAVRTARPFGVDVNSGVESGPGIKDPGRLERFLRRLRSVEHEIGS